MADVTLTATTRTEFGKGAARRLRRAGQIPAVLYGHGEAPLHLALPEKETFLAMRNANVLLHLNVEGQAAPVLALPKQVQRDPILPVIEHIDLVIVKAGEKANVEVPLHFTGEVRNGALVNIDLTSLSVLAPINNIPSEIEVSVDGLDVGAHMTVADIKLPEGVEAAVEGDTFVLAVVVAPVANLEPETEAAEGEIEGDTEAE